jgi:hypothetical protein
MPEDLNAISRIPLCAKTCAMFADAAIPDGEQAREPVDAELGAAGRHDLLGDDGRAPRLDGHGEVLRRIEAFRPRGIVPGELRLGEPLELQAHRVDRLGMSLAGHGGNQGQ